MSRDKSEQTSLNVNRSWGWVLGLGILFIILGCIGISMVVGLTVLSMMFFGALLVVAGLSNVVDVIKHKEWKGMIWQALIAVLYIVGGFVVFYDPLLASSIITALLAGVLIVIGITRIIMAMSLKSAQGWAWLMLAGITALILGVLIMIQWPVSGLWVIGLFIAVELIVTGWTYVIIAFSSRKA